MYALGVGTVEHGEVSQEAGVESGHTCRCVGVECRDVRNVSDVAPRVFVGVVEASVVQVLTYHLQRRLVAIRVDLQQQQQRLTSNAHDLLFLKS